jgi:hypothetical protein
VPASPTARSGSPRRTSRLRSTAGPSLPWETFQVRAADRDPLPPLLCDRVGEHVEHAQELVRREQAGVLTLIPGHFRGPEPPRRRRGLGPPGAAAGRFFGVGVSGAPAFPGVASGHGRRV